MISQESHPTPNTAESLTVSTSHLVVVRVLEPCISPQLFARPPAECLLLVSFIDICDKSPKPPDTLAGHTMISCNFASCRNNALIPSEPLHLCERVAHAVRLRVNLFIISLVAGSCRSPVGESDSQAGRCPCPSERFHAVAHATSHVGTKTMLLMAGNLL